MTQRTIRKDDAKLLERARGSLPELSRSRHEAASRGLIPPSVPILALLTPEDPANRVDAEESVPAPVDDYVHRTLNAIHRIPEVHPSENRRFEQWVSMIVDHVTATWRSAAGVPYVSTHGPEHNVSMLEALCEGFPDALIAPFNNESERRLLLGAIWLHDIGMALPAQSIMGPSSEKTPFPSLEVYSQRSSEYVVRNSYRLGISKEEARVLGNLCQLHAEYKNLTHLAISDSGDCVTVSRQRLVLAFLRLAELLAIDQRRVKGKTLAILSNLPAKARINREVYKQFLRNLFISSIRAEPFSLTAYVACTPTHGISEADARREQAQIEKLVTLLDHDLQAELNKIRDVLLVEAKLPLVRVRVQTDIVPNTTPELDLQRQNALANLATSRSPNAGQVISDVLTNLEVLISRGLDPIKKYTSTELDQLISLRPGHAQLRNLLRDLKSALNDGVSDQERTERVKEVMAKYRESRSAAHSKIAETCHSAFRGSWTFIVFGYSDAVNAALAGLSEETRRQSCVFVLECRIKSVYGEDNDIEYCDGLENALAIRAMGFSEVTLVPDACLAKVLTDSTRAKTCVLLGVNAIHDTGDASSTCGNLTVTTVAVALGVNVYVLAEGGKVGEPANLSGERRNIWLTNDPNKLEQLAKNETRLYNPLGDSIPYQHITAYITEKGLIEGAGRLKEVYAIGDEEPRKKDQLGTTSDLVCEPAERRDVFDDCSVNLSNITHKDGSSGEV